MPVPPNQFAITAGFPGTYIAQAGARSWYLNGDRNADNIHFTVNGNDLSAWHITYSLSGSNIAMWYHGANFNNVNERNIPGYKFAAWTRWCNANWQNCDAAAVDFYNQFGP